MFLSWIPAFWVVERRNSVTRPANGNDWKLDAKAGFTEVTLFGGRVMLYLEWNRQAQLPQKAIQ